MESDITLEIALAEDIYSRVTKNAIDRSVSVEKYIQNVVEDDVAIIKLQKDFFYKVKEKKLYNSLGNKISLTRKEERILEILIEKINQVVPLEVFYNTIWNNKTNESTLFSLRNFVKSIRDKTDYDLIENKSGEGYIIKGKI